MWSVRLGQQTQLQKGHRMKTHLLRCLFAANAVNLLALVALSGFLVTRASAQGFGNGTETAQYCCYNQGAPNRCSGCIQLVEGPGGHYNLLPDTTLRACRGNGYVDYKCGTDGNTTCYSNPGGITDYSDSNCTIPTGIITVGLVWNPPQCTANSTDCGTSGG